MMTEVIGAFRGRVFAVAVASALVACGGRTGFDLDGPGADGSAAGDDAWSGGAEDASGAADGAAPDEDGGPDARDGAPAADARSGGADAGPGAPVCGPTTCAKGCCQPDGTCVADGQTNACGFGGEPCTQCPPGDFCRGACMRYQTNCGPSNCPGCCLDDFTCATGVNDVACGQGGQQCQRCVPSEKTAQCVPQPGGGGLCGGAPSCTAKNCTGCCDGDVCLVGLDDAHCGYDGEACQACDAGSQCVTPGRCTVAGTCDSRSCSGCCVGNVCAYGDQDVACGSGGAACVDCTASGKTCTAGTCG